MKTVSLIFSLLVFSALAVGGEFTGAGKRAVALLRANNIEWQDLKQGGHEMAFGEFTGAGKKVPLKKVRLVLTNEEVIGFQDVDQITLENNQVITRPALIRNQLRGNFHNVKRFEANGESINKGKVKTVIFK